MASNLDFTFWSTVDVDEDLKQDATRLARRIGRLLARRYPAAGGDR